MGMYGADPLELRNLGSRLDDAVTGLRDVQRRLGIQIDRAPWTGADADQFRGQWRGPTRVTFEAAASTLREAAESLRRNALEQERASGTTDDAGDLDVILGLMAGMFNSGLPLGSSPDEAADWWNGLTEEERTWWISERPQMLGNTVGIPLDVRFEANRNLVIAERARISKYLDEQFDAAGDIPVFGGFIEDALQKGSELLGISHEQRKLYDDLGKLLDRKQNILYFDPERGEVAVVIGNLAEADEAAITASGTGTDFGTFVDGPTGGFMTESAYLTSNTGARNRAVVATQVWNPPGNVPQNITIGNYTKTMDEAMDNVVLSTARETDRVVMVSHSSGTNATQDWATRSSVASEVDGYLMLAAPDPFELKFHDAIGNRPVTYAYHMEDPIVATTLEDWDDFETLQQSTDANVSVVTKEAGVPLESPTLNDPLGFIGDLAGTRNHRNSQYFLNFESELNSTFDAIPSGE